MPKGSLEKWLARLLHVEGYDLQFFGSGRSALYETALSIRSKSNTEIAMVPDYVCNVVHRAVSEAGWTIVCYPTDRHLEADWDAILERAGDADVGLVVTASVFGSSAMLEKIQESEAVEKIRASGAKFIFDIAQDIELRKCLPPSASDVVSAIVSFNSKSFPGCMGGGVFKGNTMVLREKRSPSSREGFSLFVRLIKSEFVNNLRRSRGDSKEFEYSFCRQFPFLIKSAPGIAKLQIVLAIWGINNLDRYHKSKMDHQKNHLIVNTQFSETAAYLMLHDRDPGLQKRRRKATYAVDGNKDHSVRPELTIVHNKGFDDE